MTTISSDAAGNTDSTFVDFNVVAPPDTTPPFITVQFPANGTTLNSGTFQINGTASDPQSSITQVCIVIDGGINTTFVDAFVPSASGGLDLPEVLIFGSVDDNLYVSSVHTGEILRYDGTTGVFLDAFVTAGSGGLDSPLGLAFGPADSNLYVSSRNTDQILRYDPFEVATGTDNWSFDVIAPCLANGTHVISARATNGAGLSTIDTVSVIVNR